jgi:hypothetical protein
LGTIATEYGTVRVLSVEENDIGGNVEKAVKSKSWSLSSISRALARQARGSGGGTRRDRKRSRTLDDPFGSVTRASLLWELIL